MRLHFPPILSRARVTERSASPHSCASSRADTRSQYLANFFVDACRASTHKYSSAKAEAAALFYNFQTSTKYSPGFVQIYEFDK